MIPNTMRTMKIDPISIEQLTERMRAEQELYRQRIMEGTSRERQKYAHELTIRDNIVKYLEAADIPLPEVSELLCLKSPLGILYWRFDFYYTECHMPYYDCINTAIKDGVEIVLEMKEKRDGIVGYYTIIGRFGHASPKRLLL